MSSLSRILLCYGVAGLITALSALLGILINTIIGPEYPAHSAVPIFVLGVAIVTCFCRQGPGFFAGGLSYVMAEYLFIPPVYSIELGWDDVPLIATFVATTIFVDTLRNKRFQAEHAVHLSREKMRVAQIIQQKLFPAVAPTLPGFDIAGASYPAEQTGGDYFDYIPFRDRSLGILLGDVSGHGFGSALLMAETRAYLRALALNHDDVGEMLTLLNRILSEDTEDDRFITLFLARLDPASRSFIYAGAGHEGYLLNSWGKTRKLKSTSPPLGLDKDLVVPCAPAIEFAPHEILLLISDGLSEAQPPAGAQFGIARILELVHANRSKSVRELVELIIIAARDYSQQGIQADDMTSVILKVGG
jgi:serine phosphatase RsbU (regulator of sigma subunit)